MGYQSINYIFVMQHQSGKPRRKPPAANGHESKLYWQAEENEPRNKRIFLAEERRKSRGLRN